MGPRLKSRLQGLGEVAWWSSLYPGPSVDGAWEAFPWCHCLDLPSLVATLPVVGATWRVYAALYTGL
jgi:hypothetical protein